MASGGGSDSAQTNGQTKDSNVLKGLGGGLLGAAKSAVSVAEAAAESAVKAGERSVEAAETLVAATERTASVKSALNRDVNNHNHQNNKDFTDLEKSSSLFPTINNVVPAVDAAADKLPPRPDDYDYYYYQDEDGNWRNEYDDGGYVFDPDRYESDEVADDLTAQKSSGDDASNATVIPTGAGPQVDLDILIPSEDSISAKFPVPEAVTPDRSKLKIDLTPDAPKKKKLPQRPDDYEYYWYQDEDETWRNQYDDDGYEFADDDFDLEEAEQIVKAQTDGETAKAEAERQLLALEELAQNGGVMNSLSGLETIPEQRTPIALDEFRYDEYGQPIIGDEYQVSLARERWHWAFTKIVQVGS